MLCHRQIYMRVIGKTEEHASQAPEGGQISCETGYARVINDINNP